MKRRLKITLIIAFPAILLFIAFPTLFLRRAQTFSYGDFLEISGLTLILLGQIIRVSARGYKAESSRNGHALVQTGPYSLVRNPMYLGILLIGLGIVLILFKWWASLIFLAVFIERYLFLIFKEEKMLLSVFPKEYPDYQKKVPRILPSFVKIWKSDIREYLPLQISWFKKEMGSMLTLLFVVILIESWEDSKALDMKAFITELSALLGVILIFIALIIYLIRQKGISRKNVSIKSKNSL
jgi:protein-S-isoprenylcysteine O-methyltransferase Ste14